MHRRLVGTLALVGAFTVVLLAAPPAGALLVPGVPGLPVPPTQLPLSNVTDTITDLLAPPAPAAPAVPTPGTQSLPSMGATSARSGAASDDPGTGTPGNPQTGSATVAPASAAKPTATAAPGVQRRAVRSGRRVDARPRERGGPVPASTSRPRSVYFGWFGMFMALTGRDIVAVLRVAVAALCTGLASTLVARRLLHTA